VESGAGGAQEGRKRGARFPRQVTRGRAAGGSHATGVEAQPRGGAASARGLPSSTAPLTPVQRESAQSRYRPPREQQVRTRPRMARPRGRGQGAARSLVARPCVRVPVRVCASSGGGRGGSACASPKNLPRVIDVDEAS
jgi:hypothetical protein